MTPLLTWNAEQAYAFFLILSRVTGLIVAAPVLSNPAIPPMGKLVMALMLSLALYPLLPPPSPVGLNSLFGFSVLILRECAIGMMIGFAATVLISAAQTAGQFVGVQIGFGITNMIDPSTMAQISVLSTFYAILGGILFLALNGHHMVLQGLVHSFRELPTGVLGFPANFGSEVAHGVTLVFQAALKISAPVFITLLLTNLVFGIMGKIAPQMNVFFSLGFAMTTIAGLLIVAVSLPVFRYVMTELFGSLDEIFIRAFQSQ